ncbi:MAG: hypothetical protein KF746_00865 [Chitinophagaceae bacterium]|nr:hypothetical protein [Chitinophagaceae bacterium]
MLAQFFYLNQNDFRTFLFFLFFLFSFSSSGHAQQKSPAFTARLMNIEATAKETFRYNTSLRNNTGGAQVYALKAAAPEGWMTIFRTEGSQVTSVKIDSGKTQDISIEITASPGVRPGTYAIPVTATATSETLQLDLEAVVKGNYALELTTPTGRLSDDVTEDDSKTIVLNVKNTGTLPLNGVELSAQSPAKWTTVFDPSKIEGLDPGQSVDVKTTVSVPGKTIAGDYVINFSARHNSANANAAFRMTVKTSLLSGWIGMMVILLALGLVYLLIRKYGRR